MPIKTLRRALTGAGSIRLVQRRASKPFVVIVDVPRRHVAFQAYAQFADAAACFCALSGQLKPKLLPVMK